MMKRLSEELRTTRLSLHLTQRELANKLGLSYTYICRLENGPGRSIKVIGAVGSGS